LSPTTSIIAGFAGDAFAFSRCDAGRPKPSPLGGAAGGLVHLVTGRAGTMKIRPDQKVVVMRDWPTPEARLKGA
jgi:hypothetical protein